MNYASLGSWSPSYHVQVSSWTSYAPRCWWTQHRKPTSSNDKMIKCLVDMVRSQSLEYPKERERESWGICRYHVTSGPYQSVARGKLIKPLDLFVFRSCDENVCNKDLCQQTLADDFLDAACLNRLPFFSAELSTCQLTDCLHYIVTTYAKIRM